MLNLSGASSSFTSLYSSAEECLSHQADARQGSLSGHACCTSLTDCRELQLQTVLHYFRLQLTLKLLFRCSSSSRIAATFPHLA